MSQSQSLTITTNELASRLGVHEKTVRRLAIKGEIPAHCYRKAGEFSPYYFFRAAVDYYRDHGEWPSSKHAMARYSRAARSEGEADAA